MTAVNQHNRCSRCQSSDLFETPVTASDHSHLVVGERLMRNIAICRYVCTDCGHIEEWVNDQEDLKSLKAELIHKRGGSK